MHVTRTEIAFSFCSPPLLPSFLPSPVPPFLSLSYFPFHSSPFVLLPTVLPLLAPLPLVPAHSLAPSFKEDRTVAPAENEMEVTRKHFHFIAFQLCLFSLYISSLIVIHAMMLIEITMVTIMLITITTIMMAMLGIRSYKLIISMLTK